MSNSNASMGGLFERYFCKLLAEKGFWVHRMAQNTVGQQPADVIAVYRGTAYLIDCKVCMDNRFKLSRMEDNQRMAMNKWLECGGTLPVFALRNSHGQIFMLDYLQAMAQEKQGIKSVQCEQTEVFIIPIDKWLEWVTNGHYDS